MSVNTIENGQIRRKSVRLSSKPSTVIDSDTTPANQGRKVGKARTASHADAPSPQASPNSKKPKNARSQRARSASHADAPSPQASPKLRRTKNARNQLRDPDADANADSASNFDFLIESLCRLNGLVTSKENIRQLIEKNINSSFSHVDASAVATMLQFRHPLDYDFKAPDWQDLQIPLLALPKACMEELAVGLRNAFVRTGGPGEHRNEAARERYLSHRLDVLLRPFSGRLIDRPEVPLPKTNISRGGRVESTVFTLPETF